MCGFCLHFLFTQMAACAEKRMASRLEMECKAPETKTSFQPARLILSQLGLLESDALAGNFPRLTALDSSSVDFRDDLDELDSLSERSKETVHVFYVKSGQTKGKDILANVVREGYIRSTFCMQTSFM